MNHTRKIALNGMVMYIKIIINTLLTLLATRVALKNLGADSFGLYNLLAGVISMLSFLDGALIISGQRFMSIAIGQNNSDELNKIFNVCFFIHTVLSFIILLFFTIVGVFFIKVILNIPDGMEPTAYVMYLLMVASSFVTIYVIPYSAMMNAKEDIYLFALTEILSCGLRCASAFAIALFASHKLEWYTALMTISLILAGFAKVIWSRNKYPETKIDKDLMLNKPLRKQMLGFVGWNTLGTSANLVRNQGLAILLNVFFNTVVNAAYGIAHQISGLVNTIASTVTTVFAPSIIQAHGAGDDKKMVGIASMASKLTFGVCSMASLPILIFLPSILAIWLDDVPDYTLTFCRFIIIEFLLKQLVPGINRAIYATGKIKWFSITISALLVSVIPVGYVILKLGFSVNAVFCYLILAQLFTTFSELFFANKNIAMFNCKKILYKNLILPIIFFAISLFGTYLVIGLREELYSFWSICLISLVIVIVYIILYSFIIIGRAELKIIVSKFVKR